jgi:aromatic ring-opening dioxygenase catalytic subunit (LigB family)
LQGHRSLDPELHARIGRALAPLRNEGVLIIGSGSTTHNLGAMGSPGMKPVPWAAEFQAWLDDVLVGSKGGQGASSSSSSSSSSPPPPTSSSERLARLLKFEAEAPHFRKAHPREEHFIPIVVAAAAGFADVAPPSSSSTSSGAAEAAAVTAADGEAVATAATEVAPQQQQHAATKLFSAFALGTLSLASYRFD